MRKIILFMMVSADGYFEGPEKEINWHNVDKEFNEFAVEQLNSVDILLFGRVTYELMAGYWPTPTAATDDPVIAEKMNTMPKIVFSKSLERAEWGNTRLIKGNITEEVLKLKETEGKDLIIFGSSDLALSFTNSGLIDEYRIVVNPVILGKGKSLLIGLNNVLKLKLLKTRTFNSGNVLLFYKPAESI